MRRSSDSTFEFGNQLQALRVSVHTLNLVYKGLARLLCDLLKMPPHRHLRVHAPTPLANIHATPPTRLELQLPAHLPTDLFSTPSSGREISTEPASPASPTLHTRAYRHTLQREQPIHIPHAVLHYNRTENGLQPWYWYAENSVSSSA